MREFVRNPRRGRHYSQEAVQDVDNAEGSVESALEAGPTSGTLRNKNIGDGYSDPQRTVDVVLSDMSAPWYQTTGFWKRSLSNPYNRMMNTSGLPFKDHVGSMVSFSSHPGIIL